MELRVISMAPTAFSVSYDLGQYPFIFSPMQHDGERFRSPSATAPKNRCQNRKR